MRSPLTSRQHSADQDDFEVVRARMTSFSTVLVAVWKHFRRTDKISRFDAQTASMKFVLGTIFYVNLGELSQRVFAAQRAQRAYHCEARCGASTGLNAEPYACT